MIYTVWFKFIEPVKDYFKISKTCSERIETVKKLNALYIIDLKELKPLTIESNSHRLTTNLLTILSYIDYLNGYNQRGSNSGTTADRRRSDIIVKIFVNDKSPAESSPSVNPNEVRRNSKVKLIQNKSAYKKMTIKFSRFKKIGVVFAVIKTLQRFPTDIESIIINVAKNKAFITLKLIDLNRMG